ncbi:MAG TPA: hypothetical protein PLD27_01405 [bacterium]|nr:hypothetical protein [bacterium]HOL46630.1 hypothetical protein [bacterium]HPQ17798.1 hypothetical protein [bacterium]
MKNKLLFLVLFCFFLFLNSLLYSAGTPASTIITIGGDNGDSSPNLENECMLSFKDINNSMDTVASTQVSVTVDTGYDMQLLSYFGLPADDSGAIGETLAFKYVIQNLGNALDGIKINTSVVGGANDWIIKIFRDANNNGVYEQSSDSIETNIIYLSADEIETIFIVINIKTTAQNLDTCHIQVTFSDSFGTIANDNWPDSDLTNSRDYQSDSFLVTALRAVIRLAKYVDTSGTSFVSTTATVLPGDTIWFTLVYDNDGMNTGTNIIITDNIDTSKFEFVPYSANDTNYIHSSSSSDTIEANIGSLATPNWVDATTLANGANVIQIRWTLNGILNVTQGDNLLSANYTAGKDDNGYVYFKVRLK